MTFIRGVDWSPSTCFCGLVVLYLYEMQWFTYPVPRTCIPTRAPTCPVMYIFCVVVNEVTVLRYMALWEFLLVIVDGDGGGDVTAR